MSSPVIVSVQQLFYSAIKTQCKGPSRHQSDNPTEDEKSRECIPSVDHNVCFV